MKKKIIKKKTTLEDLSHKLQDFNGKLNDLSSQMSKGFAEVHGRIDNLKYHMEQKFDEQTEEFSGQIRTVLDLVDKRFIPIEHSKNSHRARSL